MGSQQKEIFSQQCEGMEIQKLATSQTYDGEESKEEIIQGNKPLGGVEVKISDFIEYGLLGQGAGGCVKKAAHRPTKKIIALKQIPLQNNEKLKKQLLIEIKTLHEC